MPGGRVSATESAPSQFGRSRRSSSIRGRLIPVRTRTKRSWTLVGSTAARAQGSRRTAQGALSLVQTAVRAARADLLAPPRDRVRERALEWDLGLPAGRAVQPLVGAAHLHHLVRAPQLRVDLVVDAHARDLGERLH